MMHLVPGTAPPTRLFELVGRLADPDGRAAAARALAQALGARDLVVFVRDEEVGALLPAPGFPQTLPHGESWQAFLRACRERGSHTGDLPRLDGKGPVPALGVAAGDEVALVLLGGDPPRETLDAITPLLPLLAATFRGELALRIADAQAAMARRAAQESRALAAGLDGARAELQAALGQAQGQRAHVKAQAAELHAIFQALPDAVYVCDSDGKIVHANARATALFDLTLGRVPRALAESTSAQWQYYPDGRPVPPDEYVVAQALRGTRPEEAHIMVRVPDTREERHYLFSAAPMYDDTGAITGAVAIATDITRLHGLEREKDAFLGIASHELRTPVTIIKANAQLARRRAERLAAAAGGFDVHLAEQAATLVTLLERIEGAAARQQRLAADLLDASSIEEGKMPLRLAPCDLVAIVREYTEEQRLANPTRAIALDLPPSQVTLVADADRIGQVVANFLSNALKYSPEGTTVRVELCVEPDRASVRVRDEGRGCRARSTSGFWERFYRVAGVGHQYGADVGMGVGLYICRTIVERHSGQIGLESAPGQGSTFWFSLPLPSPAAAPVS